MKNMKKILAVLLALTMTVCLASCGETGGNDNAGGTVENSKVEEKKEESKTEETEAPEETEPAETEAPEDQAPADYLDYTLENPHYGLKAEFKVKPIDDRPLEEDKNKKDSVLLARNIYYKRPDPHDTSYGVKVYLYAEDNSVLNGLEGGQAQYEKYEKVTIGDKEVYRAVTVDDSQFQYMRYEAYYYGDDYLDGKVMLKIEGSTAMKDNPLSQEEVEEVFDSWVKYVTVTGDDSAVKTANGDLKYLEYDITIPENVKIGDDDCKVVQFLSGGETQFSVEGIKKDDLNYSMKTFRILPKSSWDSDLEDEKYTSCTIGGREALLYVSFGNGAIRGEAIVKLDEENYLRIDLRSDGFLSGSDISDAVSIADKCKELTNEENIGTTREMILGLCNDFVNAMTIGGSDAAESADEAAEEKTEESSESSEATEESAAEETSAAE